MSDTYVKKYDVGQIKLDLPHANYIHELPLLSFGDVLHTINLNLVFNYRRKVDNSNPFYIASGYQLNLQKRIIFANGVPEQFEDGNGKRTFLLNNGNGVFTFKDDSQRIIRTTSSGYELEYSDFSKDAFNTSGIITASYDKYSSTAFLTYQYNGDKLTSISYKGKVITLTYSSNKLWKINYGNSTTELSYETNKVTVIHYSGVNYELTVSNTQYISKGSSTEGQETVSYIQELQLSDDGKTITIKDKIGDVTVNTATYNFPANWLYAGDFNQVEMTDKNGVKTRVQYEGENVLCSYEIQGDDVLFTANDIGGQFIGSVNLHNTVGVPDNNKARGIQTINDGMKLGNGDSNNQWNITVTDNKYGYYTLSGWIKTSSDITSTLIMIEATTDPRYLRQFYVSLNENHKWTYFSFILDVDAPAIVITPQDSGLISMRDFRLTYQGADKSHLNMSEGVLVNDNQEISFRDAEFCYTSNGESIYLEGVTFADIMRYKVSDKRNDQRYEAYYNNCREVISNVQDIKVLTSNGYVSVSNFDLGVKTYSNQKAYLTRYKINENALGSMIVKTVSVDGTVISTENLSANFDVTSSTVDGVTTNYERNANGLVTKEYVSGLYRYDTIYSDNMIMVREIDLDNGAVASTTRYFIDATWGGVYKVDTCDALGNIIFSTENTYDGDMSTLTNKAFTGRGNSLTYSKGNVASMSTDTLNYTFGYTNKGELGSVNKNGAGVEHHTYSESNGVTTVVSKYPSDTNALHTNTCVYDKYGRLESIDGILSNTYDLWPSFDDSTGVMNTSADNGSSLLATTTDLLRNEKARYKYDIKEKLIKKTVTDKDDFSDKVSEETFEYDDFGRLTVDNCVYNQLANNYVKSDITYTVQNSPNPDERIKSYAYSVNGSTNIKTTNTFDTYKRITKKSTKIGTNFFTKQIDYQYTRPTRVRDYKNAILTDANLIGDTSYTYDSMGRIASISANGYVTSFSYDANGQLIRENNQALDKTFQYVYNGIGNLTSIRAYSYTPAGTEPSGSYTTTSFGYDTSHPDRLTSYNGKAITYNANGGVASYDGYTYGWNRGKLSSITTTSNARILTPTLSPSKTYSFTYNALGQRIASNYSYFWVDDELTSIQQGEITAFNKSYTYDHGGRLVCEAVSKTLYGMGTETSELVYLYDENTIVGVQYTKGSTVNIYYFQRNLLGDVIGIYNVSGVKVASYSYDAYGNCTIDSSTTNYDIAHANPIRYRGYYYDEDTKLYYLNARYYSPEWRRFISPDDTNYLDYESVNGLNLYCYCNNDPVNYCDPSGHFALTTFGIWAIVGIVTFATIAGGVAQLASNALAGETGSDLWKGVPGAALGSGANALALCLLPATWGGYLAVSALFGASIQTGVDTIETLIRGENVALKQTVVDLGINFVTTFIGNWLGSNIVPTNAGWFKPQRFDSIFLKPYGQRILAQTSIGAGVSGMVNFERKFNWGNMNRIYYMPSIPSPILPTYLYN